MPFGLGKPRHREKALPLVRTCRLGHNVPWVKAWSFVREQDAENLPVL